jgi:hypothetical protein
MVCVRRACKPEKPAPTPQTNFEHAQMNSGEGQTSADPSPEFGQPDSAQVSATKEVVNIQ